MSSSKIVLKILGMLFTLLIVVIVVFGVVKLGTTAYKFGYRVYTEAPVDEKGKERQVQVQITSGMSPKEIGKLLEERGLIRDASLFIVQLQISDYKKTIKPGLYTLNTAQTAEEMMAVMSSEQNEDEEKE